MACATNPEFILCCISAGDFLFLGDFVDRGMESLPVVAYVMLVYLALSCMFFALLKRHEINALQVRHQALWMTDGFGRAMKVLHPTKWWAIRGNHETREVNGNQVGLDHATLAIRVAPSYPTHFRPTCIFGPLAF